MPDCVSRDYLPESFVFSHSLHSCMRSRRELHAILQHCSPFPVSPIRHLLLNPSGLSHGSLLAASPPSAPLHRPLTPSVPPLPPQRDVPKPSLVEEARTVLDRGTRGALATASKVCRGGAAATLSARQGARGGVVATLCVRQGAGGSTAQIQVAAWAEGGGRDSRQYL